MGPDELVAACKKRWPDLLSDWWGDEEDSDRVTVAVRGKEQDGNCSDSVEAGRWGLASSLHPTRSAVVRSHSLCLPFNDQQERLMETVQACFVWTTFISMVAGVFMPPNSNGSVLFGIGLIFGAFGSMVIEVIKWAV